MNEQQIFARARMYGDTALRNEFVTKQCGGDMQLKDRVDRLLRLENQHYPLLDRQAASVIEGLQSHSNGSQSATPNDDHVRQVLALLEPTDDESPGRLQNYVVTKVIGYGGFGVVLKAIDERLNRTVAIKVLSPLLAAVKIQRRRFLREARSAGSVRHENVVQIYSVEEHPIPFIVMECVTGQTLQQRLSGDGPLTPVDAVDVALQIARGLQAAHDKGIVHRDIKPSNILLEDETEHRAGLRVKLTDFGLAFSSHDPSLTQTGLLMGTPAYMSPEQAIGEKVDHRSDLFALGSVIFAMCTGKPPFDAPNSLAILRRVADVSSRSVAEIHEIPTRLQKVIDRLHSKRPEHRQQDVAEVISDLEQALLPESRWAILSKYRKSLIYFTVASIVVAAFVVVRQNLMVEKQSASSSEAKKMAASGELENQAGLTAQKQISTVYAELQKLNPDFDRSECNYEIIDGKVRIAKLGRAKDYSPVAQLTDLENLELSTKTGIDVPIDISFVSGMHELKRLHASGIPLQGLEPLRNLSLEEFDGWCWNWKGDYEGDISALKGMPLRRLNLGGSVIKSLEPLRGMAIQELILNGSRVDDISALAGMKSLWSLSLDRTQVTDLSPLKGLQLQQFVLKGTKVSDLAPVLGQPIASLSLTGSLVPLTEDVASLPLVELWADFSPERDGWLLPKMPSLRLINGRPIEELSIP